MNSPSSMSKPRSDDGSIAAAAETVSVTPSGAGSAITTSSFASPRSGPPLTTINHARALATNHRRRNRCRVFTMRPPFAMSLASSRAVVPTDLVPDCTPCPRGLVVADVAHDLDAARLEPDAVRLVVGLDHHR